jgi:hypothetical protein
MESIIYYDADWYYNEMSDLELLQAGLDQNHLQGYRTKCLEVWFARKESQTEQTQL